MEKICKNCKWFKDYWKEKREDAFKEYRQKSEIEGKALKEGLALYEEHKDSKNSSELLIAVGFRAMGPGRETMRAFQKYKRYSAVCKRFPESVAVGEYHTCGEWEERDDT